jgi:hypothetical protein
MLMLLHPMSAIWFEHEASIYSIQRRTSDDGVYLTSMSHQAETCVLNVVCI